MKLILSPEEPSWWIWLATMAALICGLAGSETGFIAAIVLTLAQAAFVWQKHRRMAAYPVQVRLAFAALLIVCLIPFLRWFYWLATFGIAARLVFGYCLMARLLSLMPWNRDESLSGVLLRRTFFTAPVAVRVRRGLLPASCEGGVCETEGNIAVLDARLCGQTSRIEYSI
jgi:hypothetical protein